MTTTSLGEFNNNKIIVYAYLIHPTIVPDVIYYKFKNKTKTQLGTMAKEFGKIANGHNILYNCFNVV